MGNDCCSSKKKVEIENFKKEKEEAFKDDDITTASNTPATPKTPATPSTPGVISMDDDASRLNDLYQALDEQFLYFLDKEFPFPTS